MPVSASQRRRRTATPASPPVYVERIDPAEQGSWYYCEQERGYYPYVKECPAGWQRVAPQPGGAGSGRRARAHEAGLLVRAEELDLQIREVTVACGLEGRRALSRCLECNGALVSTIPAAVRDRVPPYTFATCREFWLCSGCGRVFWAGTHVAGIRRRLEPYLGGRGDLTGGTERRPL
jgi:hypothetical protein